MKEIKEFLAKYDTLLPLAKSLSQPECERRSGEFLSALAMIANWKHLLAEDKIRCTSVQSAVYSEQLSKTSAKTITESKILVEASSEYITAREELERLENDISFLKAYEALYTNGHLFYRQLSKENG